MTNNGIPKFHVSNISKRKFTKYYENKVQPCIIEGLTDNWPAKRRWNLDVSDSIALNSDISLYQVILAGALLSSMSFQLDE